jgi:hypothetical protein
MSWTFCTSGAAIALAGKNANSTIIASGSTLAEWSDEVEGAIVSETRFDFKTSYSSVDTDTKNTLKETAAAMIAENIVSYDIGSYGNRTAETILDFLHQKASRNLKNLKDSKGQEKRAI